MTIMMIIITAIIPMLSTSLSLSRTGIANVAMLSEARWALDTISRETKYANSAQILTTGMPTGALGNALVLTFNIGGTTSNVSYYYKADGVLYRRSNTNTERPLTNPSQAAFQTVNINGVNILPIKFTLVDRELTIECAVNNRNTNNQVQTERLGTTVYLLNQ